MVIDGEEQDKTLFKLVKDTLPKVWGGGGWGLKRADEVYIGNG